MDGKWADGVSMRVEGSITITQSQSGQWLSVKANAFPAMFTQLQFQSTVTV